MSEIDFEKGINVTVSIRSRDEYHIFIEDVDGKILRSGVADPDTTAYLKNAFFGESEV
jgi:hypothetical protein